MSLRNEIGLGWGLQPCPGQRSQARGEAGLIELEPVKEVERQQQT